MRWFGILGLTALMLCIGRVQAQDLQPEQPDGLNGPAHAGLHAFAEHSLWGVMCAVPGGIGMIKDGTIVMVNDYITRLLGYSRQELLGSPEQMLYPDEGEYNLAHGELQKLASGRQPLTIDARWKAKNGAIVDVHLMCALLEARNPSAGIVFTVHDITERKKAEFMLRRRTGRIHVGAAAAVGVLFVLMLLIVRKQTRLRQSEQQLRIVREAVESSTDAIGMSTPQGRHYYQNRAFDELFGDIGEFPQKTLYVDPAVGAEVFSIIVAGGRWAGEVKMYGRDRCVLDIFLRAYANTDKHGIILSLVGIHTDITERRKTETALRESEQKVSNILNTIDDVVMAYSVRQGRVVYLSPSIEKIFGSTLEMHSKNWHLWAESVHPDDMQNLYDSVARLDRQGFSDGEFRIIRPDGSIIWVRSRSKIIYGETGEPERLDRIISDITQRKQAELALQESEQKLATLFSSMTEMVVINELVFEDGKPVNYRISDCNKAFTDITGIPRETAMGGLATDVYGTPTPPYLAEFSRVALTGESHRFETYFSPLDKYFSISVVCPGHNRFATITADITGRRMSEDEHERLRAQLAQAQKIESIGRLAGGVAHDFNNILSVILGYTDMALQQVGPEQPLRADLLEIRQAVERSTKLTRQLLAFARKQTIAPRVLDLNETVEEMLKMLRRLIGEDIDLAWLPGKGLQPVKIDPSQLDQVLANLCVNARDAIADVGRITIETANVVLDNAHCIRHPDCVPGEYVMLALSDTGCGMDRETLANIFDPFFTTKDVGTGTGLGLSTVYGIVKQNNGCIEVASEPGQGTRFALYLPHHRCEAGLAPDRAISDQPAARGTETVLLVEDEPANLEMYSRMLVRLGYTVLPAATPEDCFRLAREHAGRIDLLLTDVVMPGMNGPDLAQRLLADTPDLQCLFMSGYTDKAFNHQGALEPGIHFIQKPFSLGELADKVRDVLDTASDI